MANHSERPEAGTYQRDFLQILVERKWVLITVFCLSLVAAFSFSKIKLPLYRSSSLLLLESTNPHLTEFDSATKPPAGSEDMDPSFALETKCQLILCRPLLEKTYNHFGFGELKRFIKASDPLEELRKLFHVKPKEDTRLAQVSFDWYDPETAARVLEFHVDLFRDYCMRLNTTVYEEGLSRLEKMAAELEPEVKSKAQTLQQFRIKNNMVSVEQSEALLIERMKAIDQEFIRVGLERMEAESMYKDIARAVEEGFSLEELPENLQTRAMRDLQIAYSRAKEKPASVAELDDIAKKIEDEVMLMLGSARADYKRAVKKETELIETLVDQKTRMAEFNQKLLEYERLKGDHETLDDTYKSLIRRIDEIELTMAAGFKDREITVVAGADVPDAPVGPGMHYALIFAAFMSLLIGAGVCLIVDRMDTRLRSSEEVEQVTGFPIIGCVPYLPGVEAYGTDGDMDLQDLVFQASLQPELQETFRFIRLALTHGSRTDQRKTFLLTSALPGEGKSLVSLHVAVSMARAGKSVLLVDADLNELGLTRLLMPDVPFGLNTLFESEGTQVVESAIFPTAIDNLFFLPGGTARENLADHLESGLMADFVEEMRGPYDCVIFDTPAVGISMDAAALSRYVEGAFLVVRVLSTEQKHLLHTMDILNASGCPLLGSIINNVDMGGRGKYEEESYYATDEEQGFENMDPSESPAPGYSDYAPEATNNEVRD